MSEAVAQYIEESLELLKTEGWCTGKLIDENGSRCALGVLYDTPKQMTSVLDLVGPRALHNSLFPLAMTALGEAIPMDFLGLRSIAIYNNSRTDFAEIEVWFKQAAANEREAL